MKFEVEFVSESEEDTRRHLLSAEEALTEAIRKKRMVAYYK